MKRKKYFIVGTLFVLSCILFQGKACALDVGGVCPYFFELKGTDRRSYDLGAFANKEYLIVIITSRTCEVTEKYLGRAIKLIEDYREQGVFNIWVNVNDPKKSPGDSLEAIQQWIQEEIYHLGGIYVKDNDQEFSKALGGEVTPHVFLFGPERTLLYKGAIDDNWKEPEKVQHHYLRDALEAVLNGQDDYIKETQPEGCPIFWK